MEKVISFRKATDQDLPEVEEVRRKAFVPVFASFRNLLGEEVYKRAQEPEDLQQEDLLRSMFMPDSPWGIYVAECSGRIVGFVSVQINVETKVGEIGLNAVHPEHAGKGVGTEMYEFSLSLMRSAGLRVATVATGGDPSHAPARRAYEKAGFDVQIPSVWMCKVIE